MAEYIDKDKLIDRFDELCNTICQYSKKQRAVMCSSCELGIAFDVVDDFPAADVQPVEYGEWTAEGNDEYGNYWDECTVCRRAVFFPPSVKNDYKYCPHCGARMDGKDDV